MGRRPRNQEVSRLETRTPIYSYEGETQHMNTKFVLYTGDNYNIAKPVADETETAVWLVAEGPTKKLHIAQAPDVDTYYDRQDLFTHFANGDFKTWGTDKHFPRRPVTAPDGWIVADEAGLLTSSAVKDALIDEIRYANGEWMEYYNGKLVGKSNAVRSTYHTIAKWLISGESVALHIPAFLGNEYARTIVETLNLGEGKAWNARTEKRQEAREEKQAYQVVRDLILNGRGEEVGAEPRENKLIVRDLAGAKKNMFGVTVGTVCDICTSNGQKQYTLTWDPSDEMVLESWQRVAAHTALRVGFPQ